VDAKWLKRTGAVLAASASFAGTSAPAVAQPCPPEETVAVLDQYCDILPTAGGGIAPTAGSDATPAPPLATMLPQRTVKRLRQLGPEARALLKLTVPMPVAQTPGATARERQTSGVARDRANSGELDTPESDVESLATGLGTAGGDMLGGTFRWGLVICTLGLAGMTWFRFRARLRI
jgi:hypothetical protein